MGKLKTLQSCCLVIMPLIKILLGSKAQAINKTLLCNDTTPFGPIVPFATFYRLSIPRADDWHIVYCEQTTYNKPNPNSININMYRISSRMCTITLSPILVHSLLCHLCSFQFIMVIGLITTYFGGKNVTNQTCYFWNTKIWKR